jgi:hypothetical protein
VADILSNHYAFVPSLPLRGIPVHCELRVKKAFFRTIGVAWDNISELFFDTPLSASAMAYVAKIVAKTPASRDDWDLDRGNRLSLATAHRLRYIRYVKLGDRDLFYFDFQQAATVAWKLAVNNVADALLICRLDHRFSDYEIARYLIQHGIPFRTLLSSTASKWRDLMRGVNTGRKLQTNTAVFAKDFLTRNIPQLGL